MSEPLTVDRAVVVSDDKGDWFASSVGAFDGDPAYARMVENMRDNEEKKDELESLKAAVISAALEYREAEREVEKAGSINLPFFLKRLNEKARFWRAATDALGEAMKQ